jgi:hypothetical protein
MSGCVVMDPSTLLFPDTTLCDKVCQRLATSQWFSPSLPVFSTNKTDHNDITEILLKVALNTISITALKNNNMIEIYLVYTVPS